MTKKRLDAVIFSIDEIGNIICGLDPEKVHGQDKISISILKICSDSICKPLETITKKALTQVCFTWNGNKETLPQFIKRLTSSVDQYSYFLLAGKILGNLFFIENKLIATNQSGFKPGDSSINQLLFITHDIYKSFDEGYEVRSVFLDTPKAFGNFWHEGIIFKLKENGFNRNLLELLSDFIKYIKIGSRGLY